MVKILLILAFFLIALNFSDQLQSRDAVALIKTDPTLQSDVEIKSSKLDKEADILAQYLALHNSPLQYSAQDFVDAAKIYGLDWKLVASIAGVESTFGKFIPGGYNGWGWGVYGTQAIYFNSWRDAIFTISKGLKEDYISRGLVDPYDINKRYAASPSWGSKVTYFMNDLEKFAALYKRGNYSQDYLSAPKIAAVSGILVLR